MEYPVRDTLFTCGESLDRHIHYLGEWFSRAPVLAAVGDSTHLRQANEGWERFLGWSQQEVLSLQWTSLIHPHDLDQTIEACLIERLPLTNFPNRFLTRKGNYMWVRWYMDFPSDQGFFYSCGVPAFEETDELRDIADRRSKAFGTFHE